MEAPTSTTRTTTHRVRIELLPAFPFQKPRVVPLDDLQVLLNERHQEAGAENGALCLYPDDGLSWDPWMTAEELIERIRVWFVHYHQHDWPAEDRPPDLHMYYPGQGALALMLYGGDWLPPADQPAGRFAYWAQPDRYRAFAANPVAGSAEPARYTKDRLAPVLGIGGTSCAGIGIWLRLEREPIPHPTLLAVLCDVDLAAGAQPGWALQQLRALFGDRIHGKDRQLILALGHPAGPGQAWLFLKATLPASRKNDKRWARRTADIAIESFAAASVGRAALMRRTGHTAQALARKSVCIFGVGAIGSSVATLLGKAGVERLRLVDKETLRPGNAVRHVAGIAYVGLPKVQGVWREAMDHFPDTQIDIQFATWDVDTLRTWIAAADVVVDATASPAFSSLLNELCRGLGRPAIYAATYRRAIIGRVQIVRPGIDACLVCRAARHTAHPEYVVIPPGDEGAFVEDGCGVPTVEASAVDVEATANVAARAVLHLLTGKQVSGNECLIVNEPLAGAAPVLSQPGHHWQSWPPVVECETCSTPPTE